MPSRQADLLSYKKDANELYVQERRDNLSPYAPKRQSTWDDFKTGAPGRRSEVSIEGAAIEREIESSRFILEISNDCLEEDFVPYTKELWTRATNFLRRLAIHAHSCGFAGIGVPDIAPASQGSIDLLWRLRDRSLLINFPSGEGSVANFYGKKAGSEVSGRFDPDTSRPELIFWLADSK
jgi:hypothetical protein